MLLETRDLVFGSKGEGLGRSVSFVLESGRVIWIMGPSGEGKTSLLRTLARLTAPIGGEMTLKGDSWRSIPAVKWRRSVVYVHQKPVLFTGSVRSNLTKAFELRARAAATPPLDWAAQALERLLLPPDILDRDALTLSVGEAARVALIRALTVDPVVLLLDEPSSALDSLATAAVASLLTEWVSSGERAIAAAAHDKELLERLPGATIGLQELPRVQT